MFQEGHKSVFLEHFFALYMRLCSNVNKIHLFPRYFQLTVLKKFSIIENRKNLRQHKKGFYTHESCCYWKLKSRRECNYYLQGNFKNIFPMMREDGFGAVELHLRDSREIDEKNWIMN